MAEREEASLEGYKAVSLGSSCVVVPHDARVCAPIGKEGIKQHFVTHVTGQVSNKNLKL